MVATYFLALCECYIGELFIIYSQLLSEKNMKLKEFQLSDVDSLIKIPIRAKRVRPPTKSPMNHQKKLKISDFVRMTNVDHLPVARKERLRCCLCSTKEKQQLTQFYCTTCNWGLCINADQNCFQKFHQQQQWVWRKMKMFEERYSYRMSVALEKRKKVLKNKK